MIWTVENVNELRRLHATSMTFAEISKIMGATRSAVIGKAQRIGLTRFRPPSGRQLSENRLLQRKKDAEAKRLKRAAFRALNPPKVARPNNGVRPQAIPRPVNDLSEIAMHLSFAKTDFARQCAFPYGDGPFTFCGHHRAAGKPYCAPHVVYCEGIGTPSEKRAHWVDRKRVFA